MQRYEEIISQTNYNQYTVLPQIIKTEVEDIIGDVI